MLGPQTQAQYFTYDRQIAEQLDPHRRRRRTADGRERRGRVRDHVPGRTARPRRLRRRLCLDRRRPPKGWSAPRRSSATRERPGLPCRGRRDHHGRRYYSSSTGELPIAIKVVEEAPVTDPGEELPESEELELPRPRADGAGRRSAGRGRPSTTRRVARPSGRPGYRRGRDHRGHRAALAGPARLGGPARRPRRPGCDRGRRLRGITVQLHLIQPSRDVFAPTTDDYTYGDFGAGAARAAIGQPSHSATPTGSATSCRRCPATTGLPWRSSRRPTEESAIDVPVDLTFAVTRTDASRPPTKVPSLGQGGGAGPDDYSADTPYLVGDGEFSAVASGNPFTPDGDATTTATRGGARAARWVSASASPAWLCCVAAALWLRARRSAASR